MDNVNKRDILEAINSRFTKYESLLRIESMAWILISKLN